MPVVTNQRLKNGKRFVPPRGEPSVTIGVEYVGDTTLPSAAMYKIGNDHHHPERWLFGIVAVLALGLGSALVFAASLHG